MDRLLGHALWAWNSIPAAAGPALNMRAIVGRAVSYLGANYLAVCRAASREGDEWARQALDGLEGILKGHRDEFSFEYPCSTPDREVWFSVKEIVAIHHRTIEAASAGEHGGATFTIRLPACR